MLPIDADLCHSLMMPSIILTENLLDTFFLSRLKIDKYQGSFFIS